MRTPMLDVVARRDCEAAFPYVRRVSNPQNIHCKRPLRAIYLLCTTRRIRVEVDCVVDRHPDLS